MNFQIVLYLILSIFSLNLKRKASIKSKEIFVDEPSKQFQISDTIRSLDCNSLDENTKPVCQILKEKCDKSSEEPIGVLKIWPDEQEKFKSNVKTGLCIQSKTTNTKARQFFQKLYPDVFEHIDKVKEENKQSRIESEERRKANMESERIKKEEEEKERQKTLSAFKGDEVANYFLAQDCNLLHKNKEYQNFLQSYASLPKTSDLQQQYSTKQCEKVQQCAKTKKYNQLAFQCLKKLVNEEEKERNGEFELRKLNSYFCEQIGWTNRKMFAILESNMSKGLEEDKVKLNKLK